jgi:hypothetical protein
MKELSSKTIDGKRVWFVDNQPSTQFQYQQTLAQNKGYKNLYVMGVQRGYKYRLLKAPEQTFRIKEEFIDRPNGLYDIPGMLNYYATVEGQIWCYSVKRGRWINITQQTQKTGYKVFQCYVDGKKYVRYVHRCVLSAYKGLCAEGYEVHHIDGNNANNCLNNLQYMIKDEHRRMKKGKYKKK